MNEGADAKIMRFRLGLLISEMTKAIKEEKRPTLPSQASRMSVGDVFWMTALQGRFRCRIEKIETDKEEESPKTEAEKARELGWEETGPSLDKPGREAEEILVDALKEINEKGLGSVTSVDVGWIRTRGRKPALWRVRTTMEKEV